MTSNEGNLSQDDINALLKSVGGTPQDEAGLTEAQTKQLKILFEQGFTGISDLFGGILGQSVTLKELSLQSVENFAALEGNFSPEGHIFSLVEYSENLSGLAALFLRSDDVHLLAAHQAGTPEELATGAVTDAELSALAETMNQLLHQSSVGLSEATRKRIEMSSAMIQAYNAATVLDMIPELADKKLVAVEFPYQVEGLSQEIILHQLMTEEQALQLAALYKKASASIEDASLKTKNPSESNKVPVGVSVAAEPAAQEASSSGGAQSGAANSNPVTVQPIQFAPLDKQGNRDDAASKKNLELVMDVTLNLSVELGKTEVTIKDVLELTRGSVLELDRVAGEPVDLLANGKLIAKGEVVVIEDNFGLRITSIVSPAERLKSL